MMIESRPRLSGLLTLLALVAAAGRSLPAQATDDAPSVQIDPASYEGFVQEARTATEPYRSLDRAIADGFRRVGGDFPSLGEHWINIRRILDDRFDATRPSVLIYARAGGEPILAGVAYTAVLEPDEPHPAFPAGLDAWHEHNGTVADESLPLAHGSAHHEAERGGRPSVAPRLAILHAWIWIDNPDGVWTADNWDLPFIRLGLPPMPRIGAFATRALALAADEGAYYRQVIRTLSAGAAYAGVVDSIVITHAREARSIIEAGRDSDEIESTLQQALGPLWHRMWVQVARALPPDLAAHVDALRAGH